MLKRNTGFWWAAFALAWLFDLLFWNKPMGISFPIFTVLLVAAGLLLAWYQGERPAWTAVLLILPVLFFPTLTLFRSEPFTLVLAVLLTLVTLGLLALSLLGGKWVHYGIPEWVVNWGLLIGSVFGLGAVHITQTVKNKQAEPEKRKFLSGAAPVVRGILLAAPVILVFTALLASADAIFSQQVTNLLDVFDLKRLPEYIVRFTLILVLGWMIAGVYLHALTRSQKEWQMDPEKPLARPFLGTVEAAIVLASVNLLFLFFVVIQFRYFFGGQANINLEGFTYSEYARRGFGELLLVAFFSLLLFLGLSLITRRETRPRKIVFSGMGILLLGLVTVILVSGIQRLTLYEAAYGFTRLRTYPHVFMIWLGLLLLGVVILEVSGKMRYFILAALVAAMGFAATLGLINVDRFIAGNNIARALRGEELDFHYLSTLSADAVPLLAKEYQDTGNPAEVRTQVGAALACMAEDMELGDERPWQSFNLSRWQAKRSLDALAGEFERYNVYEGDYGRLLVTVDGEEVRCFEAVEDSGDR